jgi:hypothetical protein
MKLSIHNNISYSLFLLLKMSGICEIDYYANHLIFLNLQSISYFYVVSGVVGQEILEGKW